MTAPLPSTLLGTTGVKSSAATSEQTLSRLLLWMEQGGASFPKIHLVRQEDGERSVLARADIAEGEVVLRVPRSHLFTLERAKESEICRLIEAKLRPDSPDKDFLYMASALLEEKHRGADSFWHPYIDGLPESYPHMPLFFTESERQSFQGSQLVHLVETQRRTFEQDYASLRAKVPGYERFTLEEFIWARFTLYSRPFVLKTISQGPILVPLVDMLNHRQPPDVLWSTSEDGGFQMTARRPVAAGQEINTHYGNKSSDVYLMYGGFVPTGNEEYDEVFLSLGLTAGDPLAAVKQQMFGLTSASARLPFKVSRQAKYLASGAVFSFLRMAHATPQEFLALSSRLSAAGSKTVPPLSVANEEKSLAALAAACEEKLKAFPTSLEEDERLLSEGGPAPSALSPNARSGVLARRQEKRLLRDYVEFARVGRSLLRMPRAEFDALAARPDSPWGWFDSYVRQQLAGLVSRKV